MAQAKGILPRRDDRAVLYKNPQMCGYFIAVKLDPTMDRARLDAWLSSVSQLVDGLVVRLPAKVGQEKGDKVAAVAVGLAPSFFALPNVVASLVPPASFAPAVPLPNATPPLSSIPTLDAEVMFYVASVFEARVYEFVAAVARLRPDVQKITLDRGYQRLADTEPFGYKDGVRNALPRVERSQVVFVHRDDRELDEPVWADGGFYMSYLKVRQDPDAFQALPDDATRDAVVGRTKDGKRLDLGDQRVSPDDEPAAIGEGLPANSHVHKTGPRGKHDDTQIFRRGLPFMETTPDGQLQVGLHFCSFQASLDQFDVVFNDWSLNRQLPPLPGGGEAGVDALFDPARAFTAIERAGFYFVPPYHKDGLAAAISNPAKEGGRLTTGRLVVRKRVTDPSDSTRRFERQGFVFRVLDAQGQPVPNGEFTTDSAGRGICHAELQVGQSYTLQEVASPVANVLLSNKSFIMDQRNKQLLVLNEVAQPNTPYGG